MMGDLSEELDFPFKRCGKVLVGNTEEDMEQKSKRPKANLLDSDDEPWTSTAILKTIRKRLRKRRKRLRQTLLS